MIVHRLTALLSVLFVVVTVAAHPPASAASAGAEVGYLALGDSVASGADLGEAASYPRRLGHRIANETGRAVRYWNRARDGEQSAGVAASQLDALDELGPEVVTLTVGANDFLVPAFQCLATTLDDVPGQVCNPPDPRVTLPRLEANLRLILGRITSETSATVAVTTYYNPFKPGSRCGSGLSEMALRYLNGSISRVVSEYGERAVLVDLITVFRGHEGEEPTGWFMRSPIGLSCTQIHPNGDGQRAIADAVWDALRTRLQ